MPVYSGARGVAYMSTTGTGAAVNLIKINRWRLNMSTDKYEVTAFTDSNKTYVQGLKDISGTLSGFWDDTESKPFVGADSADGIKLYLYMSADATSRYFYGPAWLDSSIEVPVSGPISIEGNFSANGAWGYKLS